MVCSGWEAENKLVYDKREEDWRTGEREDWREGEEEEEEVVDNGVYTRSFDIAVLLPSTTLSNEPSVREKTLKYYRIIRSLSIFRVNELVFYTDPLVENSRGDLELIEYLHKYYLTPPYLRKKLIPLKNTLKYVGLTPPLRILLHSVGRKPRVGEYREGVVVSVYSKYIVYVDAGARGLFRVYCRDYTPSKGELVVFKVSSLNPLKGFSSRDLLDRVYCGPRLSIRDSLIDLLKGYRRDKYYVVATSRYGENASIEKLVVLGKEVGRYKGLVVVFGSPYYGLYDIVREQGYRLEELVDTVLNTLPRQGTKTIRIEEALHSTLTLLNIVIP